MSKAAKADSRTSAEGRGSLGLRVLAPLALIGVLLVAAVAAGTLVTMRNAATGELAGHAQAVRDLAVLRLDNGRIRRYASELERGTVIGSAQAQLVAVDTTPPVLAVTDSGGRRTYAYSLGRLGGSQVILRITLSTASIDRATTRGAILAAAVGGALLLLLFCSLLGFMRREVSRPLRRLVEGVERIRSGAYHERLTVRGHGPVAELAHGLEQLATVVAELDAQATTDPLTGVGNRRSFHAALARELKRAAREDAPLSLVLLDLDGFKEINDTHGHPFADGILQTIAERLRSRLRATDVLARVGGDEFAMLLPGMTGELATSVVHRTRSEVGTVAGGVDLSWCAGIASYPIDAQDAETLLECADAALYCAKSSSDASVCVYDPDDADASRSAEERSVIETLLEYDDAVVPVFQPLISLATGRIAGYEALARFPHPPARRPDEWFALARAYGLGPALEAYAARAALSAPDRPAGTFLSFNLSASALSSDAVLEALPHDLSDIVIEITDNTLDSDQELLAAQLGPLRARGARIAVDDAGAGYAALQHVMRVRPDIIKLDRALVANVDSDPARAALVDAYVRFARRTGAAICAEGIETPEELRVLADLEVAYGQGFGVARPAPPWSSVSAWVPGAISTRPHTNGDRPRRELALPPIRLALADGLKAGDLATVTELIATELDVDEAAVMRRAGSDAAFEAVSDHPWLAAGQKLALSRHPTIRRLIARGDAVELGAGDSGAEPDELALLAAAGARSILFAPVVSDGDVIGVLACVSRSERSWSHADTGCAVILAQELAAAVEVAPDLDPV